MNEIIEIFLQNDKKIFESYFKTRKEIINEENENLQLFWSDKNKCYGRNLIMNKKKKFYKSKYVYKKNTKSINLSPFEFSKFLNKKDFENILQNIIENKIQEKEEIKTKPKETQTVAHEQTDLFYFKEKYFDYEIITEGKDITKIHKLLLNLFVKPPETEYMTIFNLFSTKCIKLFKHFLYYQKIELSNELHDLLELYWFSLEIEFNDLTDTIYYLLTRKINKQNLLIYMELCNQGKLFFKKR
jgi:hypothetical protein